MSPRVALASVLAVSGCVAHAADGHDRVVLEDGRVIEGEVRNTGDGAYTVRLADGTEQRFAYADIARVERARRDEFDPFKAGFEIVGLGIGPRLSWEREEGPVSSFGVRGGVTVVPVGGYPYPLFWSAVAVDWLEKSPVKVETTAGFGLSTYYIGLIGGVAARFSPPNSPVRMNVGVLAEVDVPYLYYPTVFPDVSVSFLW
ncbi:MAG: hypothetical protein ACOZNI_24610 [Myxococcota bacterium]